MIGASSPDRRDEYGAELARFVKQPVQFLQPRGRRDDMSVAHYGQPVFSLVGFLDRDSEFGDELGTRAAASRRMIVR